jgi:hypothetical protein
MGLSNSMREILLKQQSINNYENNLKPVSKQTEFSTSEVLHHRTMSEIDKTVKLSKKSVKKKEEIILDKVEEISDDEEEDMSEEIKDIKDSYSDLETSKLNDIEYVDYNKNLQEPISQDISADNINESVPLLDEPDTAESLDDEITIEEEEIVDMDIENDKIENTIDLSKEPSKESSKESSNEDMNDLFFHSLDNIKQKESQVKQTHKSNIPSSTPTESSGGGGEFKKIQLTEKYDFF